MTYPEKSSSERALACPRRRALPWSCPGDDREEGQEARHDYEASPPLGLGQVLGEERVGGVQGRFQRRFAGSDITATPKKRHLE